MKNPDERESGTTLCTVQRHDKGVTAWIEEAVVTERPLYFIVDGKPLLATMRTPGDDADLIAGYLVTEGIIESPRQLTLLKSQTGQRVDSICVGLHGVDPSALDTLRRVGASTSSCGVCGRRSGDEFLPRAPAGLKPLTLPLASLPGLLSQLRASQPLFEATGGIHAAALVDQGEQILCVKEDIGRHNAIDKVAGWMLRKGHLNDAPKALISSGRTSYEVIQKAAMAGIGTVISVSAASSMAVDIAETLGMVLVGFVRSDKAIIYHDPQA